MKKVLYISLILALTSSCFFDEQNFSKPLVKDLKLEWWGDQKNQTITFGMVRGSFGGLLIIPETVFAVGYNDEFLIAKSYPNKEKEIRNRLFNYDKKTEDFLLTEPSDTIYLSSDDRYYEKNGKWYHKSNGWNPPNGLFPYKDSIYYHIIDLRNWESSKKWNTENLHRFKSEEEFNKKRNELNIPKSIDFEIVYKELE
ncbi:hypothetical protein [Tenacibaculum aiptasiae]|uniref:hypothetical protein n=1 Tax=Tenacibaculum aiptasiae TaxID=426481 RepID=UPI003B5B274A